MKRLIFIVLSLLVIISCKKDNDTIEINEEIPIDSSLITLMDTVVDYGSIKLRIFGNESDYIQIKSSIYKGGSTGQSYSSVIVAHGGPEFAYKQKCDSAWFMWENRWLVYDYSSVSDFELSDTVFTDSLNFTTSTLNITSYRASASHPYYPDIILGHDLVCKKKFYIVARGNNYLVWIKLEILGYSSLVIWEYGYSDTNDKIIIGGK
jgi:hypothetical protein